MNSPLRSNRYMLFLMLYQLVFAQPALFFISRYVSDEWFTPPIQIMVFQILSLFIPFVIYLIVTKQSFRKVLPINPIGITNVGLIILMCICIQPLMMLLSAISLFFFENNIANVITNTASPVVLLVIAVSVFPSILEEINFRGIILQNHRKISIKKAALINGLFFGIIHLDPQQFLYACALGIVFTYFVHYTKSILSAMLAHFIINFSQIMLGQFLVFITESAGTDISTVSNEVSSTDMMSSLIFLIIASFIFLPSFIILFVSFIKHNIHRNGRVELCNDHCDDEYEELNIVFLDKKVATPSFYAVIVIYIAIVAVYMNIG